MRRALTFRIIDISGLGSTTRQPVPVTDCIGARWAFSEFAGTDQIDGHPFPSTWVAGNDFRCTFPVIYDEEGLPCRYAQVFGWLATGLKAAGSVTLIETSEPMSQRYRVNVRIVPLNVSTGTPVEVPLKCAAAAVRIFAYDRLTAHIDGILLENWGNNVTAGILIDFPPVYDRDGCWIQYDQVLHFTPGGTLISGSVTLFELVPITTPSR